MEAPDRVKAVSYFAICVSWLHSLVAVVENMLVHVHKNKLFFVVEDTKYICIDIDIDNKMYLVPAEKPT